MVVWVKTTIDIADGLLVEAKDRARQEGTTLRDLVERGLQEVLRDAPARAGYCYQPVTCELVPAPAVDFSDWRQIKTLMHEGYLDHLTRGGDDR